MNKEKNNMNISATAPISQFNITLGDEKQTLRNIGEEWTIDITPPQRGRFFGSFGLKVRRDVNLVLRINENPDDLEIMPNGLFRIRVFGKNYDSNENGITIPLKLSDLETRFQLFFNPSAVTDSKKYAQKDPNRIYHVKIVLAVVNTETSEDICHTGEEMIAFSLTEVHTRPEFSVKVEKEWKKFLYKRDLKEVVIGSVCVDNPAKLKYYPSIDFQAKLTATLNGKPVDSSLIHLDIDDDLYGNDSFNSAETNLFEIEDYASTSLYPHQAKSIEIPIVADIQKIGNPFEAKSRTYKLELEVTYRHHGAVRTDVLKESNSFTIERDAKKAELHVFYKNEDKEDVEIFNEDTVTLERTEFAYDKNSPYTCFHLTIRNTADSGLPHAGLVIDGFQHTVKFEEENVKEKYVKNGIEEKVREKVFHFKDSHGGKLLNKIKDGGFQLDSDPGCDVQVDLTYSGRDIVQLFHIAHERKVYETTVLVTFSFKYWLNDDGYDIEKVKRDKGIPFSATLRLPVYQKPCDKWLGIDFGTSAIVSMYDNETLDLRNRKKMLNSGETQNGNQEGNEIDNDFDPRYEKGTKFLSSNTIFRVNALRTQGKSQLLTENAVLPDYHSLAVCLSPTWKIEQANHRFVLPCLKLMVGYDILPQLETFPNGQFSYFTVNGGSCNENRLIDEQNNPTTLAHVDNVFKEVYSELFQYYIRESLPQDVSNEKINRIVLTVPNTFSPRHRETVEEIVRSSLNNLEIRDICFVSESDAVACYYLKHRHEINKSLNRSTDKINEGENILVYDMGAGTLDLSLFSLEPAENNTRKVTVLGNIGLSKAGNYLDYVLANILVDILQQKKDEENAQKLKNYIKNITTDTLDSARDLKNFIKEELKPALSKDKEITLNKDTYENLALSQDIIFKPSDILKHRDFKGFIYDCTGRLIKNFFKFLQLPGNFKLDTVVVSGRSSKLLQVREALDKALEPYKDSETFRIYNTSEGTNDVSKTAVVEGAMMYAEEKHSNEPTVIFCENSITPCYGVIYSDQDKRNHYLELFNPRTAKPIIQTIDGRQFSTYVTEDVTIDLRYTKDTPLLLIQSYSGNTENDWNNGNMDYISIVQAYSTTHMGRLQDAKLHVEVDTQNMIKLAVNNTVSDDYSPNRIDITKSSIGDSLWPRVQE